MRGLIYSQVTLLISTKVTSDRRLLLHLECLANITFNKDFNPTLSQTQQPEAHRAKQTLLNYSNESKRVRRLLQLINTKPAELYHAVYLHILKSCCCSSFPQKLNRLYFCILIQRGNTIYFNACFLPLENLYSAKKKKKSIHRTT